MFWLPTRSMLLKGGTSALINEASIRNYGLEVSLQADWISRRKLNWNTGLIFANNKGKVLQVYNSNINQSSPSWQYISGSYSNYLKGYAVGALFNYRYAGLDNTGYPLIYDKDGKVKRIFTNDAKSSDVSYAGSSIPVFNLGLSNRVDIGNFYVYCMINYYGGFKVRVPVPNASEIRPLEGANNYWTKAGDEKDPGILPNVTTNDGLQHYFYIANTDKYTVNGSYLTLGDLTVAYNVRSSRLLKRAGIGNMEIKAQASEYLYRGIQQIRLQPGYRQLPETLFDTYIYCRAVCEFLTSSTLKAIKMNKWSILMLLSVLLSSCDKYLDVKPKGKRLLETTADFDTWLNNSYSIANGIPNELNQLDDNLDIYNIKVPATTVNDWIYIWRKQYADESTPPPVIWKEFYESIYYFNTVLQGIDDASGGMPQQKKNLKSRSAARQGFQLSVPGKSVWQSIRCSHCQ